MFNRNKSHTLNQCRDYYLEDCMARGQSPRTLETKKSALRFFVEWCERQEITRASKVKPDHMEQYRLYLCRYRQPFNFRPLDIATQRNRLTAVKVFFRRLKRRGIIIADPAIDFELPRVARRLPKGILNITEIESIFDAIPSQTTPGIRDRAVMETYFATGIRRMELANLDIADIDLITGLVTVIRGKGSKDRRVPMANRACNWIERYLALSRPILACDQSGAALFLDNKGFRFRGHQLSHIVSAYIKASGVRQQGACNLFRHSTATLMHENGADLRYIQEMLGHADISTTQIYTHVTINRLRAVYAKTHPAAMTLGSPNFSTHSETKGISTFT